MIDAATALYVWRHSGDNNHQVIMQMTVAMLHMEIVIKERAMFTQLQCTHLRIIKVMIKL